MTKTIGDLSIDTQALYERLIKAGPGEQLTYASLSELIGRDVAGSARGCLRSARSRAQRLDQVVFGTVIGVGVKRLSDVEIIDTGEMVLGKIRRASRRGFKTITSISDYDALPNEAKIKHNTFASMFGAVSLMARSSEVKKLQAAVAVAQERLPLAKTLEAFKV